LSDKPILDVLEQSLNTRDWQLKLIHDGTNRVYCADPADPQLPVVAVKCYANPNDAQREYAVLSGLRSFGMNLAPEALAHHESIVIMTWTQGEALKAPPSPDDTMMWNRMMAAFGASGEVPFMDYTRQIPMMGKGYQNPGDVMDAIDHELSKLDPNADEYEALVSLAWRVRQQTNPRWINLVSIGLCRRNHKLSDLLWDGSHLLTVDWKDADWGDMAAEIGMWNAHPDYESLPPSHWVWVRWEFARLVKDPDLVPRATTYARLMQVWWTVHLTLIQADTKLRDRYWKRAEKLFPI
jgi:hypothetical protein